MRKWEKEAYEKRKNKKFNCNNSDGNDAVCNRRGGIWDECKSSGR